MYVRISKTAVAGTDNKQLVLSWRCFDACIWLKQVCVITNVAGMFCQTWVINLVEKSSQGLNLAHFRDC